MRDSIRPHRGIDLRTPHPSVIARDDIHRRVARTTNVFLSFFVTEAKSAADSWRHESRRQRRHCWRRQTKRAN
jgi:hypothetical protein